MPPASHGGYRIRINGSQLEEITIPMKKYLILIPLLLAVSLMVACSDDDDDGGDETTAPSSSTEASRTPYPDSGPTTLRLGYFPNITHAAPLVGLRGGIFGEELGANVTIEEKTFNAGPAVIEALFAGEIDASFIGPNPAINGYVQSDGEALRIVSGATSGGALFVVRPEAGISAVADLESKKIATPQLGNTQDVALRKYLLDNDLGAKESGGNVEVIPSANADTLSLFQQGNVDGAWVPEPWGTRLIQEAGGELFLDEGDLWPGGLYVTTHLIVSTSFLEDHPDVVERLVRATVKTTEWIGDNPDEAKQLVNEGILEISGAALPDAVINAAWENLEFTYDPIVTSLFESAQSAYELGFLEEEPQLDGIYDLSFLATVLEDEGLPPVEE
jgi:NitT/TauT family transport system substrate-binding protein